MPAHRPFTRAAEYYSINLVAFAGNIAFAWVLTYYGGVHYLIATAIGFIAQTGAAFFANRAWTFPWQQVGTTRGLATTTGVQLSVLFVAIAGTAVGVEIFGWSFLPSRIAAGILAGLVGYMGDSNFTFDVSPFR